MEPNVAAASTSSNPSNHSNPSSTAAKWLFSNPETNKRALNSLNASKCGGSKKLKIEVAVPALAGVLTVLAHSKDAAALGPMLRTKHRVEIVVASLPCETFVLSVHRAVLRLGLSDCAAPARLAKFQTKLQTARMAYEVVYVLIQDNTSRSKVVLSNERT